MKRTIIYSATGVAIAISSIMIFAFLGNGSFNRVVINVDNIKQMTVATPASNAAAFTVQPIDIKVKNIVAEKTADSKAAANIQVAFDVHNPNTNTMILDGIRYNVYVNNVLMTSGNIGTEAPEDVIRSQNGFPIIGNSTVTMKDAQTVQRNNINAVSWDKMVVEGKTSYVIKGTYYYRQTANLQTSGGAKEFTLTFP
jgi:LEA14-like dessication related protein